MKISNFWGGKSKRLMALVILIVLLASVVEVVLASDFSQYCEQNFGKSCRDYCRDKESLCKDPKTDTERSICEEKVRECRINLCKKYCEERFNKEGIRSHGVKLIGPVEIEKSETLDTTGYWCQCNCVDKDGDKVNCFFPNIFWEDDCPDCSCLGGKPQESRIYGYSTLGGGPNGPKLYCQYLDSRGCLGKSTYAGIRPSFYITVFDTAEEAKKEFNEKRDLALESLEENPIRYSTWAKKQGISVSLESLGIQDWRDLILYDKKEDRYAYNKRMVWGNVFVYGHGDDWRLYGCILYKNYKIYVQATYIENRDDSKLIFSKLEECAKAVVDKKVKKIFGRAFLDDAACRYPYGGLRNAKVELKHRGKTYNNYTDDGGFFEFDAEVKKDDQITLTLYLEDEVDGKNYIKIFDKGGTNPSHPVYIENECKTTDDDLRNGINFDFDKKSPTSGYRSASSSSALPGLVKEYIIFEDAVTFALEELKADIKSVSIHANDPNAKTVCKSPHYGENAACYDPANNWIILGPNYVKFWPNQASSYSSPYTEFHEFGHHIMFCHKNYNPPTPYTVINHGGMINPTTHDSLCEGEADFMALLMQEYKELYASKKYGTHFVQHPSSVMHGKNFEANYKAWSNVGGQNKEDDAVTSLLWDFYDAGNPVYPERLDDKYYFPSQNKIYDKIDLSLKDLWSIIKSSGCKNVLNLYTMLTTKYPSDKEKINNLFIAHGFFRDKDTGDGEYNGSTEYTRVTPEGKLEKKYFPGEPFHDKNNDGSHDSGEPFVDLGSGHKFPGGQVYDADEDLVGTASNYVMFGTPTKLGRQIGPIVENSHILVKNKGVQEFLVKVEFEPEYSYYNYEYLANSHEGLLYVSFPPSEYKTTVAISPISEDHLAEKSLKIESCEYFDLITKSAGEDHFLGHEFELKPKKEAYVTGLTFESRSKPRGNSVQIPLTLNGIEEKIGNMDITLSYDPSVLEATEVTKGDLTSDSLFEYNIMAGTIMISLADAEGFSGNGTIAYVKFDVIGAEGSSTSLQIAALAANRAEDYEALVIPTNDGVFRVEGGLTVSVSDATGAKGSTVGVPINLEGASDVGSMDIVLKYDADVLRAVDVEAGALGKNALIESNTAKEGVVIIALADSSGINGDGAVAIIAFEVIGNVGATSYLTLEAVSVHNLDLAEIIPTTGSGMFEVI